MPPIKMLPTSAPAPTPTIRVAKPVASVLKPPAAAPIPSWSCATMAGVDDDSASDLPDNC